MEKLILRYTDTTECTLNCTGCYLKDRSSEHGKLEIPEADETHLYVYHNDGLEDPTEGLTPELNNALKLCKNPDSISSIMSASRLQESIMTQGYVHSINGLDHPAYEAASISIKSKAQAKIVDQYVSLFPGVITLSHTIGVESPATLKDSIKLCLKHDNIDGISLMVRKPVKTITEEAFEILTEFCIRYPFVYMDQCLFNMLTGWDCTKNNGKIAENSEYIVRHILDNNSHPCMYPSETCLMGRGAYTITTKTVDYIRRLTDEN